MNNNNNHEEEEICFNNNLQIPPEQTNTKKAFVGGFRNSKTGKEFHHACTQSDQSNCFDKYKAKFEKNTNHLNSRQVQTQILVVKSAQSKREYGTQMERSDLKMNQDTDKFIDVGNYINSDDYLNFTSECAIVIQRLWRCAIARVWTKEYKDMMEKEQTLLANEICEQIESEHAAAAYEIERRQNPKFPKDFKLILKELEESNNTNVVRLKEIHKDDPIKLQSALLVQLGEFTSTRAKIDQKWQVIKKKRYEKLVTNDLNEMATSHSWLLSGQLKGDKAIVDTPETMRAAELLCVMTKLKVIPSSDEERLQTLSSLRDALNGSVGSKLLKDIVELISREEDWLRRGRSGHLTQLRKRLLYLMTNYIKCVDYNPAIECSFRSKM